MLTCPVYASPLSLASASASVAQKETMMPSPALGSVSTWKPSKPRCRPKIGPRPRATPLTSAPISGEKRMFVTLAYTTCLLPPVSGQLSRVLPRLAPSELCRCGSGDLAQPARLDLVDKAAHALLVRHERARLDPCHRLAHVLLQVREGLHREVGLHPHLLVDLGLQLVVGEGEHPAVGVVDQDYLPRAQQALGDRERADLVGRDHASGVADDVGVSLR